MERARPDRSKNGLPLPLAFVRELARGLPASRSSESVTYEQNRMNNKETERLIGDLLGSAHVFVSALSGILEQALLNEIAGNRLTFPQLKILKLLEVTDARNIGDVAAFLGVSDAAASKAVDRMVRRKYLQRTEARTDRRRSELALAAQGRRLLKQYEAGKARIISRVFRDFAPEEVLRASEFLERMTKAIVNDTTNPQDICLQCGIYLQKRCLVREAVREDCSYQRRQNRGRTKAHAAEIEVPARGGSGMGPPD